jgi:tellurite resistance protein
MQRTETHGGEPVAIRLRNFPVSFFAVVMGLGGLTLAWQRTGAPLVGSALLILSVAVFGLLAALYATKATRFPQAVVKEFSHPVRINFIPTFSISLLLLAVALLEVHTGLSYVLWLTGAVLHLLLTLWVMNFWINHPDLDVHHINPAWFIPVVGNIVVPLAGVVHGAVEASWFFFSIGLVFWLVLLTLIVYRIIFHSPLPDRLLPTFAILIAPPAVGFLAYTQITGTLDGAGRVLYGAALFMLLLLVTQIGRLRRIQFFLSWWAYSFPVAALTIATLRMSHLTGITGYRYLAYALLAILTALIALLAVKTLAAVARRQICVEEG